MSDDLSVAFQNILEARYQWQPQYDGIPKHIRDPLAKRYAHTLLNYHAARDNFRYLRILHDRGLTPEKLENGALVFWWWITSATIISLGVLTDAKPASNGVLALQYAFSKSSKKNSLLKPKGIKALESVKSQVKHLKDVRDEMIAHSNLDYFEKLSGSTYSFDYDMAESILQASFEALQAVQERYFLGEIQDFHDPVDQSFVEGIASALKL